MSGEVSRDYGAAGAAGAGAAAGEAQLGELRELRAENERLRAVIGEQDARLRLLDRIVAVLAHDLRSPLSAIVMANALLGKLPLDERAARAVLRIHTSNKRADRLVRDLADCVRCLSPAGLHLTRATVDLQEVVAHAIEEARLAFPERRISLSVEGPTRGEWDFERLGQIVASLLAHALRSSNANTDVTVEIRGTDQQVHVAVNHLGEAAIDPIRSAVTQPNAPELLAGAGAGVGEELSSEHLALFLVAQIVRAHGGRVDVRSARKEGTTFAVHLPR